MLNGKILNINNSSELGMIFSVINVNQISEQQIQRYSIWVFFRKHFTKYRSKLVSTSPKQNEKPYFPADSWNYSECKYNNSSIDSVS